MVHHERFLPSLVAAMTRVHEEGAEVTTVAFTELIEQVVRVFDYLGAGP